MCLRLEFQEFRKQQLCKFSDTVGEMLIPARHLITASDKVSIFINSLLVMASFILCVLSLSIFDYCILRTRSHLAGITNFSTTLGLFGAGY